MSARRVANVVLRVVLVMVFVAEANTVWTYIADRETYRAAFPAATTQMLTLTVWTSAAVGVTAVLIWLHKRWAVWLNLVLGLWSLALVELVDGSRMTQLVILVAWAVTTFLPMVLWRNERPVSPSVAGAQPQN
jgi:hypothetical protein